MASVYNTHNKADKLTAKPRSIAEFNMLPSRVGAALLFPGGYVPNRIIYFT